MKKPTIKGKELANLKKLAQNIKRNHHAGVNVGILNGKDEGGVSIVQKMATLEFGATIEKDASKKSLYFNQRKDGSVDNQFVKKNKSNFVQDVSVRAHTIIVPARAPFRKTIAKQKKHWVKQLSQYLSEAIKSKAVTIEAALTQTGEVMAKDIQDGFEKGLEPALKPSTIKDKMRGGYTGHAHMPGIRTGGTRNAITAEYVKKVGGK